MDKAEKTLLTPPLPKKCKQSLEQLHALKVNLLEKQKTIIEQNKEIEEKIKKLSKINKSIKINHEQRTAFEKDCNNYMKAIDKIMQEIDQYTAVLRELQSPDQMKKITTQDDLIAFNLYAKAAINQVKLYIKKASKNIAVSYSQFSYSFETQKKQLDYIELQLSR